jgi:adenylate kinase
MKKVILIYGAPGAGKGTQADLLAKKLGFYHFDTGKYIEQTINDPENLKSKKFQKEKAIFDSGKLNTPSWVLKDIVIKNTKKLAKAGVRIVFSGSPRTLFEAFGDEKTKGLIETLEKLYGKENIGILYLDVKSESSVFRNSNRAVCSVCGAPVLYTENGAQTCPFCGAPLRKRSLDNPETIKVRLEEYKNRTQPILEELKKRGYEINIINGKPEPFKVFEEVKQKIN